MGRMDAMSFAALAFAQRMVGGFSLCTTVVVESETSVVHTTKLRFLGIDWMSSREQIELDPDGHSFRLEGESRLLTMPWRRVPARGSGRVAEDALSVAYKLEWFGASFEQQAARSEAGVTLTQVAPGLSGRQQLRRRELLG